jgi:hypothetical protein
MNRTVKEATTKVFHYPNLGSSREQTPSGPRRPPRRRRRPPAGAVRKRTDDLPRPRLGALADAQLEEDAPHEAVGAEPR